MLSIGYTGLEYCLCRPFPISEVFRCGIRVLVASCRRILRVRKNFSPTPFLFGAIIGNWGLLRRFDRREISRAIFSVELKEARGPRDGSSWLFCRNVARETMRSVQMEIKFSKVGIRELKIGKREEDLFLLIN